MGRRPVYGHKAAPANSYGGVVYCVACGLALTFVKQANQPDQWRHPKRKP